MPYLAGMILFALMIAPVMIKIDLAVQKSVTGRLSISVWGMRVMFHFTVVRDEKGNLTLQYYRNGSFKSNASGAGSTIYTITRIVRAIKHGSKVRKILAGGVEVIRLRLVARISHQDAAKTALLSQVAQEASMYLSFLLKKRNIPHTLRTWPDFSAKGSAYQGNCILFGRLGNLLLAVALIRALLKGEAEQEKTAEEEQEWNTPLET